MTPVRPSRSVRDALCSRQESGAVNVGEKHTHGGLGGVGAERRDGGGEGTGEACEPWEWQTCAMFFAENEL